MRSKAILCIILGLASAAYAKDLKPYQTGKLLQMDSVKCGVAEKDAQSFAGEMLGPDSSNKKTQELLCQEYVLQAESVIYRIRPRAEKHPVLLPVGERAQFRETLVTKGRWRKSSGRATKESILTWGDLAGYLKG